MVDQLAAAWLPVYGHPVVQAPHLGELARGGVVFESAYCASPLCAPSRAGLLTGRLPSRIGVYDNAAELPASEPTVTHLLRAQGYRTRLVGKMHFVGPDQLHGYERRLTTDVYPADLDWTPDWRAPVSERLPWYHSMESVLTPGPCVASMQMDYDDEVAFRAVRELLDLARSPDAEPFFLTVSFTSPHDPWEIRPEFFDRYDPAAIPLPAVGPLEDPDPHSRRLREMYGADEIALSEEQLRAARHGYFAAISYADAKVGEVLRALAEAGLREDTVVAFTADHGEMLGERGLWYKMSFLEASARVPLIVSAPGRLAPRRVTAPVSLLDLAPTLVELAAHPEAGEATADMDGESLLPLLEGSDVARGDVVAEYLAEGVHAPALMVRRGTRKYVACEGDPDLLYDLATDPLELEDLGATEAAAELREVAAARWDVPALARAVLDSQRRRRLVSAGLVRGHYTPWDFTPTVDGGMSYVRSRGDLYEIQRRARLDAR